MKRGGGQDAPRQGAPPPSSAQAQAELSLAPRRCTGDQALDPREGTERAVGAAIPSIGAAPLRRSSCSSPETMPNQSKTTAGNTTGRTSRPWEGIVPSPYSSPSLLNLHFEDTAWSHQWSLLSKFLSYGPQIPGLGLLVCKTEQMREVSSSS